MKTLDHLACSADVGRINPTEEILLQVIVCPKMKFNRKSVKRPTMALSQCIMRVEIKASCISDCTIAAQIIRLKK